MDTSIPSELTGPLPRIVRITGSGTWLLFVALAAIAFAAISSLWAAINLDRQMTRRASLRREGSVTSGQLTRVRNGKNMDHVDYSFNVNGTPYTGKAEMPWQLRSNVGRSSNAVPILYLPQNPNVNHPADWEWSLYYWIPLKTDLIHMPEFSIESQFLMAALIGWAIGLTFFMSLLKERKLLASGVPTTAVVTKCTPGTRGSYSLQYEFRTDIGTVTKGKSGGRRREVGTSLSVLYLPQDPRQSQPYPTQLYRVAQ